MPRLTEVFQSFMLREWCREKSCPWARSVSGIRSFGSTRSRFARVCSRFCAASGRSRSTKSSTIVCSRSAPPDVRCTSAPERPW